jgi:hypothetical protein
MGVGDGVMMIAAEHPTRGRSSIIRVAEEERGASVELTLRDAGVVEGRLTRGNRPAQGLLMMCYFAAESAIQTGACFSVTSGMDGYFRFDSMPPGAYELSYGDNYRLSLAVIITNDRGGEAITKKLTVESGQRMTLDLDFPAKPTLLASLTDGTSKPRDGRLFLLSGTVTTLTAKDLDAAIQANPLSYSLSTSSEETPVLSLPTGTGATGEIEPGNYTACASYERPQQSERAVFCKAFTVTANPDLQELTMVLP